jgi:hypothetical protein
MGSSSLKPMAVSKAHDHREPHGAPARSALHQALIESVRCQTGGEVIVRAGERTGRLYFFRGRLAWVTASSMQMKLTEHLVAKGLASAADIAAVFVECRRQGGNFAEMLVAWQVVDRERMRAEMLEHISRAFSHILEWGEVATMFVPSSREYKGNLTYSVAELVDSTRAMAPEKSSMLDALARDIESSVGRPAAPSGILDERVRASVVVQLKRLRSAVGCLGSCFVGDGVSLVDLDDVVSTFGEEFCACAVGTVRAASEASAKAGLGACSEVTFVAPMGALMGWRVTAEGAGGGILIMLLGPERSIPLTRIVVERSLLAGPLRQVPPEVGS